VPTALRYHAASRHPLGSRWPEHQPRQRQIDQLVYDLYGLTDEEIRIVEQALR